VPRTHDGVDSEAGGNPREEERDHDSTSHDGTFEDDGEGSNREDKEHENEDEPHPESDNASPEEEESEEQDEPHRDGRSAPEQEDEDHIMTECLKCGYLNLLNVTTCHNCRLHFVKLSYEENQRELAFLRERIGIRTVWTARGFQSDAGRHRKNARKQLAHALKHGHENIAEYFRNDERYRAAKMSEGWTQENIHQLDELAHVEGQHAPMKRQERENAYGRYADRVLPECVIGDSVRRPYELFPGEAETKGKGKPKGRGKGTHSSWNESYTSHQGWRSDRDVGERWNSTRTWSNVGSSDTTWWDAPADSGNSWSAWNPR
jgi:hypothetical protein